MKGKTPYCKMNSSHIHHFRTLSEKRKEKRNMLVISSHILHGVWNIEERCRATYETINLTLNVMKLTAVSRSWQPHMLVSQNWRYLVAGVTFFQDELDCLLLAPVLYLLLKLKKNYRLSSVWGDIANQIWGFCDTWHT